MSPSSQDHPSVCTCSAVKMRITIITIRKYLSPRDMGKVHEIMGPVASCQEGGRGAAAPTPTLGRSNSFRIRRNCSRSEEGGSIKSVASQVRLFKPPRALVLCPSSHLLQDAGPKTQDLCLDSPSPRTSVPDICLGSLTILRKTQYVDITTRPAPNKTSSERVLKELTFSKLELHLIAPPPPQPPAFPGTQASVGKGHFIFRCGYCLTFHPQRIWMLLACGHTDVLEALPLLCSICSHLRHCVSRCAVPSPRTLPAPSAFLSNLQALPLPSIGPHLPGHAAGLGLLWGPSKTTFCFFVKMTSEGDKRSCYCPDPEREN